MKPVVRTTVLLFGASLALRLALALPVVRAGVWPVGDEVDYLASARGLAAGDRDAAYVRGVHPPLAPAVMAIGLLLGGGTVGAARLAGVLVSAVTTGLVYLATRRLAGERSARLAAAIHLVHPGFASMSHLLWSETTFLPLVIGAIWAIWEAIETDAAPVRIRWAATTGLLLGAAALTRVVAVPLVFVTAAFLWRHSPASRAGRARGLLALSLLFVSVIAPWLLELHRREQRWVLLSTVNGVNLLIGQSPALPGEEQREQMGRSGQLALAAGRDRGTDWDRAGRAVALARIRAEPAAFAARAARRLAEVALPPPNSILERHVTQAVYPPLPAAAVAAILLLEWLTPPLLVVAALSGFAARPRLRSRGLLGACALVLIAPALVAVAMPRVMLPAYAVGLPLAAWGLAHTPRRRWLAITALVASVRLLVPPLMAPPNSWSGHAIGVAAPLARAFPASSWGAIRARDWIALRTAASAPPECGEFLLTARGRGAALATAGARHLSWRPAATPTLRLRLEGPPGADHAPFLEVRCAQGDATPTLLAPTGDAWRRWRGVGPVVYTWLGGDIVYSAAVDLDSLPVAPEPSVVRNVSRSGP